MKKWKRQLKEKDTAGGNSEQWNIALSLVKYDIVINFERTTSNYYARVVLCSNQGVL